MFRVIVSIRALVTSSPASARVSGSVDITNLLAWPDSFRGTAEQLLLDGQRSAQRAQRPIELADPDMVHRRGDGATDIGVAGRGEELAGKLHELIVVRLHVLAV